MVIIDFNILILLDFRFFIAVTGSIILGEIPPMPSTSFIDVINIDEESTRIPQVRLPLNITLPLYVVTNDEVFHFIGLKKWIDPILKVEQKSMLGLPDMQTCSTD
jgi:hypothetical protein